MFHAVMVGPEPGIQQTSSYCCPSLLSHLMNGPTEAQKMLEVTEPLDSKAGLCDSESPPGGTSPPCLAVPGPAPAPRFPPFVLLSPAVWEQVVLPWCWGEAEAGNTRVAICFPLHGPFPVWADTGVGPGARARRTWMSAPRSKLPVVPRAPEWANSRASDRPSGCLD